MAPTTNRKLQSDIERCLKRVSEGRADFEDLWQKVQSIEITKTVRREEMQTPQYSHPSSKDQNLREKLMGELKKELKKLQRFRDMIRTWALLPDMRDPEPLHCARRDIEHDMERFKVCERESKTKAFSKVGLTMEDKLDPSEMALQETTDWLRSAVSRLEEQIEAFEADLETLGGGEGRRTTAELPPRVEELEALIQRHRQHIIRMEQVLRLLANDQVSTEEVETVLRDGIEYYIESALEPDFEQSDADLYEPLPLEHVDESIGKLITKHERPTEVSEDESPPPMKAKTVRMSKSAKKAAARAAAQAETAAVAKREAAACNAALVSGPSTPVLAINIGGSMRSSSEITAGSAQGTQPGTPGSGRSMTSGGNSWAERFILATPTALTLPPCAAPASEVATLPADTASQLPVIEPSPPHDTAPPPSPMCVGFLPPGEPADVSHDQQQAEHGAGEGAEPLTQLHLPPGLHLSGEEQLYNGLTPQQRPTGRVRAEMAANAALQRLGRNTPSRAATVTHMPRQTARHEIPALPESPTPPARHAPKEVVLSPTMWPAINAVAKTTATPTLRLNRAGNAAQRRLIDNISLINTGGVSLESTQKRQPSPESGAANDVTVECPHLEENGKSHSASLPSTPLHSNMGDDLSVGSPMTPIHAALSLPILQPPKPPPPTPALVTGVAQGKGVGEVLVHATSNSSRKSKATNAAAGTFVHGGGSCPSSPHRGLRSRRTSLPTSPLTSPSAGSVQNDSSHASHQHKQYPPPPSTLHYPPGIGGLYKSGQNPEEIAMAHPRHEGLGYGIKATSKHLVTNPSLDLAHCTLQTRVAPSPTILRQLTAAAQSRPIPADSLWPVRPSAAADGSFPEASTQPAPPTSLAPSWPSADAPLPPALRNETAMRRMSRDTLFYAFHFQQGTARQLWAARELKAQGCRFHKQLSAWFSRASEPRVLAPAHEQGTFLYFDFHLHGPEGASQSQFSDCAAYNGWCMRASRPDFVFEYNQMEDEVAF